MLIELPPTPNLLPPERPAIFREVSPDIRRAMPLLGTFGAVSAGALRKRGGGAAAPATRTYVTSATSTANATNYTFSSQTLGGSASDYIVVSAHTAGVGSSVISSVTVEGNATTQSVIATNGEVNTALHIRQASGNATGDVVVNNAGGKGKCGITIYRVSGIASATAHATASDTTSAFNVDVNVQSGGVVIAAVTVSSGTTNVSWTGVTEDVESAAFEDVKLAAASYEAASASTPLSIAITNTGGTTHAAVSASWSP